MFSQPGEINLLSPNVGINLFNMSHCFYRPSICSSFLTTLLYVVKALEHGPALDEETTLSKTSELSWYLQEKEKQKLLCGLKLLIRLASRAAPPAGA